MTISNTFTTQNRGLHIYTAGVALQEFFIFVFLFLVFQFQRRLKQEESDPVRIKGAKKLLLVAYISLGLISVRFPFLAFSLSCHNLLVHATHTVQFRILFRIIEFSAGAGTKLTNEFRHHEVYQYVFDALPMLAALVSMNIFHPGKVLAGDDSKFAKQSKVEKRAEKEDRRQEKRRQKAEKRAGKNPVHADLTEVTQEV